MIGLQAARELVQMGPDLRVLTSRRTKNEQYCSEVLKAGASSYGLESVADRDLMQTCRVAMRDEQFLYPGAVTAVIRDLPTVKAWRTAIVRTRARRASGQVTKLIAEPPDQADRRKGL
jgi:DNA-binding NarL/FixJ family response regulator